MKNKSLTKSTNPLSTQDHHIDVLYLRVSKYLRLAKQRILEFIDTEMVNTYWMIGREIIEEEQLGESRATYGEELIKKLSERLTYEFGKGYSISNLRNMRRFYLVYQNQIRQTVSGELAKNRYPLRDKVMFLLSVKAGLRAKEISHLCWFMITDASGQVSDAIHLPDKSSKGKLGRVVPLNLEIKEALFNLFQQPPLP